MHIVIISLFVFMMQAKFLAQMIVLGGQAVARAFRQALRQEYNGKLPGAIT